MSETMLSILRVGGAVYIGLCLLIVFRQSRYVFYPDRDVGLTPDYFGMTYDEVCIQTQDGETLMGWFVPASPPAGAPPPPTILFCHGNAGDIGDRVGSIKTFHDLGLNVFIFDYRGYGHSTGKPSEQGTYLDAQAAWNYLKGERGMPASSIVIAGRSLGGAVASWLAGQVHPGALYIESTVTSAPDMAAKMFPLFPTRLLCRFRYDTLANLRKVSSPVFVAHSRDDEMIPLKHGQRIHKRAREPKRFMELSGGHNDGGLDVNPACQKALIEFLGEHLK